MTSSYQKMLTDYYENMTIDELRYNLNLEFGELFNLTGRDWLDTLLKETGAMDRDMKTIRRSLLVKAVFIINQFAADYRDHSTKITQKDIDTTLRAIEIIFLSFDEASLMQIKENKFQPLIRFVLETKPMLLTLIVSRMKKRFYVAQQGLNSDFTFATLGHLALLNQEKLRAALPTIYTLFVNPTADNPKGLYSKEYSQATQDYLKKHVEKWFTVVPNIWM